MTSKKVLVLGLVLLIMLTSMASVQMKATKIAVNVLFTEMPTKEMLKELASFGKVGKPFSGIPAVSMLAYESDLPGIQALPYVEWAGPDAERSIAPLPPVAVEDFANGLSTWNLDAINVTDVGFDNRAVEYDGTGVYVAVLDTGLLNTWRNYFPEERIAEEYAIAFQGGPNAIAAVAELPNKWERDVNSHGTHVTSTILGYDLRGAPINGVAPLATVIPVKVLNQNGSGTSGMVAQGIVYVADLKKENGPLEDYPVVINMSLGGSALDAVEQAAIDYAINAGVIIVASAGNQGVMGMGYPGAYAPVISVAAAGWLSEWTGSSAWWYAADVDDPTNAAQYYITDFSSRAYEGQDLDVAAPGSWIVGPYQVNNASNAQTYYFLGGTSMASPHVAGLVALMAQKNPALTAGNAEMILEGTALPLGTGCVTDPYDGFTQICWEANATGAGLVQADAALLAVLP